MVINKVIHRICEYPNSIYQLVETARQVPKPPQITHHNHAYTWRSYKCRVVFIERVTTNKRRATTNGSHRGTTPCAQGMTAPPGRRTPPYIRILDAHDSASVDKAGLAKYLWFTIRGVPCAALDGTTPDVVNFRADDYCATHGRADRIARRST